MDADAKHPILGSKFTETDRHRCEQEVDEMTKQVKKERPLKDERKKVRQQTRRQFR